MTKEAALHAWFNSFGIPFYPSTAVPEDAVFPWGTYEPVTSAWDGGEVALTVNLWYHTASEAPPNAKAREISRRLGRGGTLVPCDGGAVWLKRGAPFCQSLADAADPQIKRRCLNLTAEFLTLD